jgi:hypothetical protein
MRDAPDARSLLAAYAEVARGVCARLRPLIELVQGARAVEPDLDLLARTGDAERRIGSTMFARNFVARGFARPGLDAETVADLVWVFISPEVYLLRVRANGQTDDEYQQWLATALELCLLAPQASMP